MKLAISYDNRSAAGRFRSGWGFSCLAGGRALFDTGEDFISIRDNIREMNLSLEGLEAVLLSHRHRDHTGGLEGILDQAGGGIRVYGCSDTEARVRDIIAGSGCSFIEADSMMKVGSGIYSTGQIEGEYGGEPIMEQSMVIRTDDGLAVITGCSHPGLETIIKRVKELFGGERILLLLGGFHLGTAGRKDVFSIARLLQEEGVERIAPAHCTGEEAARIFKEVFGGNFIPAGAGKVLEV